MKDLPQWRPYCDHVLEPSREREVISPVELVRAIYADVSRGDLAAITARLAPDFVAEQNAHLPFGGRWDGPLGFAAMGSAILLRAFPGFSVEPMAFRACGSAVLVDTRVRAPAAHDRPALDQPMQEYWEFRTDSAVACRPFYDDPELAARSAAP